MHGIDELTEDTIDSSVANIHLTSFADVEQPAPPVAGTVRKRTTRVSLTIRYVPKARVVSSIQHTTAFTFRLIRGLIGA
jgi:hypothetical protein